MVVLASVIVVIVLVFVVEVTPTSSQYNHGNLLSRDPEIIDFGGLDGPGAVQTRKIYDFWVPEKYVFMFILIRSWG